MTTLHRNAPCPFCGYSGPNFFQAGTHAADCPWHNIGGLSERLLAFDDVVSDLFREVRRLRVALAAAPRWVSVTERLPEIGGVVPVKLDNGYTGYSIYNGAAWVPFSGWRRAVTHWLELPPAPEVTL